MNFVNEQHIVWLELRQNCGEVACAFECWARRDVNVSIHFRSNDGRHCCFAKPWWASQQNMVSSLTSTTGGFKHNPEVFFQFTLPYKLIERLRSQASFVGLFNRVLWAILRIYEFFTHDVLLTHSMLVATRFQQCQLPRGRAKLRVSLHLNIRAQ